MRVLIKYWRENAIRIACFIDDGAGTAKRFNLAKTHSSFVKNSLKLSGFVVNEEKSVWHPTQKMIWLGIHLDLKNEVYTIPEERIVSTFKVLHFIINSLPYTTARTLAKLCGKLISLKFVMGDIVRLKTRNLYYAIESRLSWDSRVVLSESKAISELFFWEENLRMFNSKNLTSSQE